MMIPAITSLHCSGASAIFGLAAIYTVHASAIANKFALLSASAIFGLAAIYTVHASAIANKFVYGSRLGNCKQVCIALGFCVYLRFCYEIKYNVKLINRQ